MPKPKAPTQTAPTAHLAPGTLVANRYEIRDLEAEHPAFIGYRAFDRDVDVEVALWHLRDELFGSEVARQGFVGAVVDMRSVRHRNLRRMFDAGDVDGVLYATAQLGTEDGLLPKPGESEALSHDALVDYAAAIANGLGAAHKAGLVHGRMIPSDIAHVAGLIKVSGVGLFAGLDAVALQRIHGDAGGRFISPEVLAGGAASPASDVYSLAAILVELAVGTTAGTCEMALRHVRATAPELGELLATALSADPGRRPARLELFVHNLRGALGEGIEPPASTDGMANGELAVGDVTTAISSNIIDALPPAVVGPTGAASRASGKGLGDFASAAELETMTEGPWVAARGAPPASPAPVLPEAKLGAPVEIHSVADSADTLLDAAPVPPQVPLRDSRPVVAVSHKPASQPGQQRTPKIAVADRPEMQPRVRPISSIRAVARPANLGNYAAPQDPIRKRERAQASAGRSRRILWFLIGGVVAIAAIVAGVLVLRGGGEATRVTSPSRITIDAAPAPGSAPVVTVTQGDAGQSGPCPANMAIAMDRSFCIDRYESPGAGRFPAAGLSYAAAAAACAGEGKRLCAGDEWETACRGERGASWPYGTSYRKGYCNVDKSKSGVVAAGSFPACRSAMGAFDMSGNVAEWTLGGIVRGGSAQAAGEGRCSSIIRRIQASSDASFGDVGFRCCVNPAGLATQ